MPCSVTGNHTQDNTSGKTAVHTFTTLECHTYEVSSVNLKSAYSDMTQV